MAEHWKPETGRQDRAGCKGRVDAMLCSLEMVLFGHAGSVVISRVGQLCGGSFVGIVWVWYSRHCQGSAGLDRTEAETE